MSLPSAPVAPNPTLEAFKSDNHLSKSPFVVLVRKTRKSEPVLRGNRTPGRKISVRSRHGTTHAHCAQRAYLAVSVGAWISIGIAKHSRDRRQLGPDPLDRFFDLPPGFQVSSPGQDWMRYGVGSASYSSVHHGTGVAPCQRGILCGRLFGQGHAENIRQLRQ